MAYDPTHLGGPFHFAGQGDAKWWILDSIDLAATVIASGYISDGLLRQMSKGDLVTLRRWDSLVTKATLDTVSTHYVTAVSATGAVTLSAALNESLGLTVPVFSGTGSPGVSDDIADGYALGSLWVETDVDDVYITTDNATGAAIWKPIVSQFTVEHHNLPIDNDTTLGRIDIVVPCAAKLIKAFACVTSNTVLGAGSVTITLSRNATAVTNGAIFIAGGSSSSSVAVSCTPTAANVFAAGDKLRGAITAGNTLDLSTASFVALFERTI